MLALKKRAKVELRVLEEMSPRYRKVVKALMQHLRELSELSDEAPFAEMDIAPVMVALGYRPEKEGDRKKYSDVQRRAEQDFNYRLREKLRPHQD
jgi:hypothetical protein